MQPTVLKKESNEYANLIMAAAMMTHKSPMRKTYVVDETYFDYGQDWKWTTILREGDMFGRTQVLCPRDYERICLAETLEELRKAVEEAMNDRHFGDKEVA